MNAFACADTVNMSVSCHTVPTTLQRYVCGCGLGHNEGVHSSLPLYTAALESYHKHHLATQRREPPFYFNYMVSGVLP